jgi:hypothetical protein
LTGSSEKHTSRKIVIKTNEYFITANQSRNGVQTKSTKKDEQSFHIDTPHFWVKNENTRVRGKIYFILIGVYLTWILKI